MAKRKKRLKRSNLTAFSAIAVFLLSFVLLKLNTVLADSRDNPLRGSTIEVDVENPYNDKVPSEYPSGNIKDCLFVTISAMKSGNYLNNQPLIIQAPAGVTIRNGSNPANEAVLDTGNAPQRYCIISERPITANLTVKLKNNLSTKKSFRLSFKPNGKTIDTSDKDSFFYDKPITLTAEIRPWMQNNITRARVYYTYTRRYKQFLSWKYRKEQVVKDLSCRDGQCSVVIEGNDTAGNRVKNGTFSYKFEFMDENEKIFSKTFKGKLKNP